MEIPHGTRVEIELEARYHKGQQSVDNYLQQTAIANPHVNLVYEAPDNRVTIYEASTKELPRIGKSIRPHPHGIELGVLIKMMQDTRAKSLRQFLTGEFSRVSPRVANEVIETSGVRKNARTASLNGEDAKAIYAAIQETKILAPSTDCVVPIGEEQLVLGLKQVVDAAFFIASTRRPTVYRGNPFIIEVAIAYGTPEKKESHQEATGVKQSDQKPRKKADPEDQEDHGQVPLAKVIRFANRVPLLYQQGACAIFKSGFANVCGKAAAKRYGQRKGKAFVRSTHSHTEDT